MERLCIIILLCLFRILLSRYFVCAFAIIIIMGFFLWWQQPRKSVEKQSIENARSCAFSHSFLHDIAVVTWRWD